MCAKMCPFQVTAAFFVTVQTETSNKLRVQKEGMIMVDSKMENHIAIKILS